MKMKRLKEKAAWALVIAMTMATPGFAALAQSVPLEGTLGVDYKLVKLNAGDKATFSNAYEASPSEASPSELTAVGGSNTTTFKVGGDEYKILGETGEVFYLSDWKLGEEAETAGLPKYSDKFPVWLEKKGDFDTEISFDEDVEGYELTADITNLYLEWETLVNTSGVEQLKDGDVGVMGLPEGKTMTVADLSKRFPAEDLQKELDKTANTYNGLDEKNTLQFDMNVEGYSGPGVKVKMGLPTDFSDRTIDKSVVVIHFGENNTEVIEPEETRDPDGAVLQIGFTLKDFSPVVVAIVDKMVDVRVENVKGGYVYAYSGELWYNGEDETRQPLTFLPIGETVKIPAGTRLQVAARRVGNSYNDEILVSENGKMVQSLHSYQEYLIEADETVFTGVFSERSSGNEGNEYPYYEVETSPNSFEPGKIKTQLKAFYYTEEVTEGQEVTVSDWKLEASEYDNGDLFTLTPEGILESKGELKAGEYDMWVNFVHEGQVIESQYLGIEVGTFASFSMYFGYSQIGSNTRIQAVGLEDGFFAQGTSIGDIRKELAIAGWNPGLYGYEFAGWMSMAGNNRMKLVEDTDVLTDYLEAYARFKKADGSYYDPKILPLGGTEEPDEPVVPDVPSGGGSSGSSSSGGSSSTGVRDTMFGTWEQDEHGWKFLQTNGTYAAGQWGMIKGVWYLFGEDTYMKTGWNNWNNRWYYLDETKGSNEGVMLVGWQLIKDKWYYLNPISDGTRGAMLSNQWVGDYFLDVDGSWIEGRTK